MGEDIGNGRARGLSRRLGLVTSNRGKPIKAGTMSSSPPPSAFAMLMVMIPSRVTKYLYGAM